jgi:hypothetical protein
MDQDPSEWVDHKVDEASEVYQRHGRIFRWMWVAVGFVVVAVGLAMIVVPGPVTVVVPAGLVMLAAVFGWARRLLLQTVQYGEAATHRFQRADRRIRALTYVASASIAGAVVAWFVLD